MLPVKADHDHSMGFFLCFASCLAKLTLYVLDYIVYPCNMYTKYPRQVFSARKTQKSYTKSTRIIRIAHDTRHLLRHEIPPRIYSIIHDTNQGIQYLVRKEGTVKPPYHIPLLCTAWTTFPFSTGGTRTLARTHARKHAPAAA